MNPKQFSVIVPTYNSQNTLEELFLRTQQVFEKLQQSFEMIFVDDYSKDDSWKMVKRLKQAHPDEVVAVKLSKNYGQHSAISCGVALSRGEYLISIDDDLQIPPEEIEKLIATREQTDADVVYGLYSKKKHSLLRNAGSRILEKIIQYYANSPGKGSSFKLMKASIAKKVVSLNLNNVYLDEIIGWFTDDIEFVKVQHLPRAHGASGYSSLKLLMMTLNIIVNYTTLPLRMMTYGGMLFSLVFFVLGIFYIYDKVFNDVQLGFTSLIVAIFFVASIILLCLGIIGEYIRRLYTNYHSKPAYSIKHLLE